MESSLLCLVVPHKAGSEEREHWGGGQEGGAVHVRVRRKKRGHVSEKNQIWARKRKGGCHMGDQCGRRSRDQGKQGWEYLSMTVSTLHHKSFLETRNKVI